MSRRSGEAECACGLKSHVEADLAVVLAGIFEARDLKRSSTVPSCGTITCQFRTVPLKKYWRTVSSVLASFAGDARGLGAGAVEKLAPAPDRLRVGHVDGRRVEGERARP